MSLCHSVYVEAKTKNYEAVSPDELGAVLGSGQMGYTCVERSKERVKIQIAFSKREEEYEILKEMPFDSKRKKQSIVLRRVGGNSIVLMTKGADDVMLEGVEPKLKQRVAADLSFFSKQGLRTLVHGWKVLTQAEWLHFAMLHMLLESNLELPDKHKKKQARDHWAALEQGLDIVGVTAVEDLL